MSTRNLRTAGKGNFVPLPAKKAAKQPAAALSAHQQRPARSLKSPSPGQSSRRWQNSPLERLQELLTLKQQLSGVSVRLSGDRVSINQRSSVSVATLNPSGK